MNPLWHAVRFQTREYAESTKLYVEIVLTGIGLLVINPGDSPK
jgi:hypothetical protein